MEGWVKGWLNRFNTHKSVGPNGMHPWVLKEQADDVSKPLANIIEKSWQTGEVPDAQRKGNATPIFKKKGGPRKQPASQHHLHPWKGDRTGCSGDHHQACRRKEGHQE